MNLLQYDAKPSGVSFRLMKDETRVGSTILMVKPVELYILYLEIESDHRRQGYGFQFLTLIEQYARDLKFNTLRIAVVATNTIAIHLYLKFGFQGDQFGHYWMLRKSI